MAPGPRRLLVVTIVVVEVGLAVAAWRDLAARSGEQVRGRRRVWLALLVLNPGNSLLYWLFGRR